MAPGASVTDHPASGKKRALLIAVQDNRIKGFHKLHHAHRDVQNVKDLLIEVFGYPAEETTLMMEDDSITKDLWPTKSRIKKQIRRFVHDASAGDHLFFYYSGHGHQIPCDHHTESDGLDEVIYTCRKKQIMDNELRKWLVDPLPPGCKLFALWDSCHSQTILDLSHYICNEPGGEQYASQRQDSGSQSLPRRVFPKYFRRNLNGTTPKNASTIASHELRGRSVARASVSITAVSAGNSPPLSSKWLPFSTDIRRMLSPSSWFECNGKCPLQAEGDLKCAHVISLSACRDNESAFDDACGSTFTQFFINHLREKPKSTLQELLLAVRQRVDEITEARRRRWSEGKIGVIARPSTFSSDRRLETEWVPQVIRRGTEVHVSTLDEFLKPALSSAPEKDTNKYCQKPSYSSHYRLNLDELVDL